MLLLNLKPRYPFKCKCGNEVEAAPSVFMFGFQMNMGGIGCPKCHEYNQVGIDDSNERMVRKSYEEMGGNLPAACYREATPEEEKQLMMIEKVERVTSDQPF